MGLFERWKSRFRPGKGLSARQLEALRKAIAAIPGLTTIAESAPRQPVTIGGIVTETTTKSGANPQFRVRLTDGTGDATLLWNGRESIPGLEPGVFLEARGTLGAAPGGEAQIIDPKYSIQVMQ